LPEFNLFGVLTMASNTLIDVATYQMSGLALLQNMYCYINKANTKFKNFDRIVNNRGATVTFDLPPRFTTSSSLVANFQDSEQRVQSLTVDQAENVAYEFTSQEEIFNVHDYMDRFGRSAVAELGAKVEANVAKVNLVPYRFFGDGSTAIDSYTQLSRALAFYRNYGSPMTDTRGILSDIDVPAIIGSGLSQFAPKRNDEIAYKWMVGDYDSCEWYRSNLLPVHTAGNVGENATTLTVVSINAAGDQITVNTGGGADADAIKENDLLQFSDGVSGQPNMRYLTFIGHTESANPVQVRATADAPADGSGDVVISIDPPLVSAAGKDQNINNAVAAGMELTALPSHRAGLIYGGDALYLAMPRLPEQEPFPTANAVDPDSGVSMRLYYGTKFGENQKGFVNDVIWGKTLVPEYGMRLVFPL
jgi:hypothetical protein